MDVAAYRQQLNLAQGLQYATTALYKIIIYHRVP